ncbi:uncharacterized protein LOC135825146 [Sycon ciliatum]|uniref:uncharacterized protein LOC135825146 n=1 Tax=Sycon ciliatum TaxID=27933 RepID=UPI0031F6962D
MGDRPPAIPPPGPFPIYVSLYDAATRWLAWTRSFKLYLAASKIGDDDQQRGLLQYLGGDDIQQLVPTLSNTGATFDDLAKALQDEFDKHQNKMLLRFNFHPLRQQPNETMEGCCCRVGDHVKRSGFSDTAAEKLAVLDQLIIGCKSDALRRKLLEIDGLDSDKALKAARAYEASITHARTFRERRPHQHSDQHAVNSGHHAIHSLEIGAELFSTDSPPRPSTAPCREDARRTVHVNGIPLTVLVDSGASHDIINTDDLAKVAPGAALQQTDVQIFAYGSTSPLLLLGSITLCVSSATMSSTATFLVVAHAPRTAAIVGRETAMRFGLIQLVHSIESPQLPDDLAEYHDRFQGLGCINDVEAHIYVDGNARPVAHAPSKVAVHLQEDALAELHEQLALDVIEPATGPTPWVARMVVVPKRKGKVRLTQDFRDVNAVAARERHPIPTLEEITSDMPGVTVFTELDMNKTFHQISLAESSRLFTVFHTPLGLMRCKRLAMGLASASEILQRTMDRVLAGLPGVRSVHDNYIHLRRDGPSPR